MKYLFKIILIFVALLAIYSLGLELITKPSSAETSVISNYIRLANLQQVEPHSSLDLVIVGSSLSARLDEGFFENKKVLNLGLEGSGSKLALEMWQNSPAKAHTILIEVNSMLFDTAANDDVLKKYLQSSSYKLQSQLPCLNPNYRVSSVIYYLLKQKKDRLSAQFNTRELKKYGGIKTNVVKKPEFNISNWELLIKKLQPSSSKIIFMMLPDNGRDRTRSHLLSQYLAAKYQLEILNFKQDKLEEQLQYTDGLHLNLESARQLAQLIDYNLKLQNND